MDSNLSKHSNKKKIADELFLKLLEEYPDNLEHHCSALGNKIDDLLKKPSSDTKMRGLPSNMKNIQDIYNDERRLVKILKVLSEVSPEIHSNYYAVTPSIAGLYKALNIPYQNPKKSSCNTSVMESYSIFHTPADLIQYNIEKSKQKFNKSLQIIKRLESLKQQEHEKAETLIMKSKEREKKILENINKKEEDYEKITNGWNDQRTKILMKKKEIQKDLNKQFHEYGIRLEKRMDKLSLSNQNKVKEMCAKQHEKMKKRINDDYSKIANDEQKIKAQALEINEMMQEFQIKIEKSILSYEDTVKKRIENARENNIKVEQRFSQSLTDYNKRVEENLKKVISKSLISEEKRAKKRENFKKYSDGIRNSVKTSFLRNSQGIDSLNQKETLRIKQIENRVSKKTKIFDGIKSKFEEAIREKRQKNLNRFEDHTIKYSKALETQVTII
jgi:hypothetical protein